MRNSYGSNLQNNLLILGPTMTHSYVSGIHTEPRRSLLKPIRGNLKQSVGTSRYRVSQNDCEIDNEGRKIGN